MLNEAWRLAKALEGAGISPEPKHPRIQAPGKTTGPALRVRLDSDGRVVALESVTDDEWPGLWTVREGNMNSFPVIRPAQPLVEEPSTSDKDSNARDLAELALRLRVLPDGPDAQPFSRLQRKASELEVAANGVAALADVGILSRCASRAVGNLSRFRADLLAAAVRQLECGELDDLDAARLLLFGGKKRIQLALDLDSGSTIYRAAVEQALVAHLPAGEAAPSTTGGSAAFSGGTSLQTGAFPKVPLPYVNNKGVALFSMFGEAACNERYGLTESAIVPVPQDAARQMQDALAHIVSPEREGKTWRGVASGRRAGQGEARDLLVAYVDGSPDLPQPVVSLFGAGPRDVAAKFEVDSQVVCAAFSGLVKERPESCLNLVLFRSVSEGQAQAVFTDSPSVQEVLDAAVRWQEGARNVPDFAVPLPRKKGERAEIRSPSTPFPDEVVRLLSVQWVDSGRLSTRVEGVPLADVLEVMLGVRPTVRETSARLLNLMVTRTSALLMGIGGASTRRDYSDFTPSSRQSALVAFSTAGILLAALGRQKEEYMESQAYLVGRMLNRADLLHREYCRDVRDGAIPPQLLGNSLMAVARDSFADALDRLGERLPVYRAWEAKSPASAGLGSFAIREMGDICAALTKLELKTETTVTDRAELLIGYLAWTPRSEETKDENVQGGQS